MAEIDESCDDDAMVIACIQELDEFVARKLRRYPIDAVAVAAGSYLAGLLGALFDEHPSTNSRLTRSASSYERWSRISSTRSAGPEPATARAPRPRNGQ